MKGYSAYRSIAKIVTLREVASVLWVALLFQRKVKVCLSDVVLALNLVLRKTSPGYAEEACLVNLGFPISIKCSYRNRRLGIPHLEVLLRASPCHRARRMWKDR